MNEAGDFTATASLLSSDRPDPAPANHQPIALSLTPNYDADVQLSHFLSNPTPVVGGVVSYTVQVSNGGPAAVNATTARWVVGDGLTVTEVTASQGSYSAGSGDWTIGALPVGQTATLSITATVNEAGDFTATASLLSSDRPDPAPANHQPIMLSLTPNYDADVQLSHFLSNPTPVVGGVVSYTVQVSNGGPAAVNATTARWVVGDGLTVTEVTASQGSYSAGSGDWTIGALPVGQTATLSITATVNEAGDFTATASLLSSDRPDPAPANHQPIVLSLTPNYDADVQLSHFLSNPTPVVGGVVSYTVQVSNGGPAAVNATTARWVVGDGLTVTEVTASQGSYSAGSGDWTIGALPVGQTATLSITATVNEAGDFTATASLLSSDRPDPAPANHQPIVLSLTPNYDADVQLSHFLSNPTPVVGGVVSYTVQVSNGGPAAVNATTARWVVGDGLTVTEVTASQGSYSAGSGDWTIGALPVGQTATLSITATVNEAGDFTATASLLSSDRPDPAPANHQPIVLSLTPTDGTAPVITPAVTGSLGTDGWYVGNVQVAWTVIDAGSPITSQTGCDPVNIVTDTVGQTITCTATSAGGTSSQSVTIKRDTQAPNTTILTPANDASYDRVPRFLPTIPAPMGRQAIASCAGPVPSGSAIDTVTEGPKTFAVTATDAAGNAATVTRAYTVSVAVTPVTAVPTRPRRWRISR